MEIIYKFVNQFLYQDTEKSFIIIIKKKYTDIFKHSYIAQDILRGEFNCTYFIYINKISPLFSP